MWRSVIEDDGFIDVIEFPSLEDRYYNIYIYRGREREMYIMHVIHLSTYLSMNFAVYVHIYIIPLSLSLSLSLYVCVYIYIYVDIYICIYIYIYIHIHTEMLETVLSYSRFAFRLPVAASDCCCFSHGAFDHHSIVYCITTCYSIYHCNT